MAKSKSEGRFAYEGLDRVIHEKARLSVLTSLVAHPKGLVFGDLKQMCGLTDGNLSRHLQVLQEAGLVAIEKGYDHNRPQTIVRISPAGKQRYLDYLAVLEQVVRDAASAAKGAGAPRRSLAKSSKTSAEKFFARKLYNAKYSRSSRQAVHVAIIMDGNGRWAERRELPRSAGHREGIEAVRRVVEAAPDLGVGALTLFAFSADNWRRPPLEVEVLMLLLRQYLRRDVRRLADNGVRLKGDRPARPAARRASPTRSPPPKPPARAARSSRSTSRSTIRRATRSPTRPRPGSATTRPAARRSATCSRSRATAPAATSICMIRTGGEKRLSDFLLWECAYAELFFTDTMWPDFGREHLRVALNDFRTRERRFGGLAVAAE